MSDVVYVYTTRFYLFYVRNIRYFTRLCITFIIYLTNTHVIYNIGIRLSLLLFIHVKMPSNQSFENTYNV